MSMPVESRLDHLSAAALFERLRDARASGDTGGALDIQELLAHRLRPKIAFSVRRSLPRTEVDDLTSDVVIAAGKSISRADSLGAFIGWLRSIARKKVSSHYRAKAARPQAVSLDGVVTDDGHERAVPGPEGDPTDAVDLQIDINNELDRLRPDHRRVVKLLVFEGYTADEVAEKVEGVTPDNAYKIASRFRARLKAHWGLKQTGEGQRKRHARRRSVDCPGPGANGTKQNPQMSGSRR